jgi:hypothetical protein
MALIILRRKQERLPAGHPPGPGNRGIRSFEIFASEPVSGFLSSRYLPVPDRYDPATRAAMLNPVQTTKADARMDLRDAGQVAVPSFNAISPVIEAGERGNPEQERTLGKDCAREPQDWKNEEVCDQLEPGAMTASGIEHTFRYFGRVNVGESWRQWW